MADENVLPPLPAQPIISPEPTPLAVEEKVVVEKVVENVAAKPPAQPQKPIKPGQSFWEKHIVMITSFFIVLIILIIIMMAVLLRQQQLNAITDNRTTTPTPVTDNTTSPPTVSVKKVVELESCNATYEVPQAWISITDNHTWAPNEVLVDYSSKNGNRNYYILTARCDQSTLSAKDFSQEKYGTGYLVERDTIINGYEAYLVNQIATNYIDRWYVLKFEQRLMTIRFREKETLVGVVPEQTYDHSDYIPDFEAVAKSVKFLPTISN